MARLREAIGKVIVGQREVVLACPTLFRARPYRGSARPASPKRRARRRARSCSAAASLATV